MQKQVDFKPLLDAFKGEVKLIESSKEHVDFLRRIHPYNCVFRTYSLAIQKHSVYRYIKFWLPLLLETNTTNETLVPPVDVAWLWHSHRLSPLSYAFTCWKLSNSTKKWISMKASEKIAVVKLFERKQSVFLFSESEDNTVKALERTKELWTKRYGTSEPFYLDPTMATKEKVLAKVFSYDILKSATNQMDFLWQVSRSCFKETEFLSGACFDYVRFLELIKSHPKEFSVPRYDIDLMWHTHMTQSPYLYLLHCTLFVGFFVNHDDSLTDRSPKSSLMTSWDKIKIQWKDKFNEDYTTPDKMHLYGNRGKPPLEYWFVDSCREMIREPTLPQWDLNSLFNPVIMMIDWVEEVKNDSITQETVESFLEENMDMEKDLQMALRSFMNTLGIQPGVVYVPRSRSCCWKSKNPFFYYVQEEWDERERKYIFELRRNFSESNNPFSLYRAGFFAKKDGVLSIKMIEPKYRMRKNKGLSLLRNSMSPENEGIIPGLIALKPGGEFVTRVRGGRKVELVYTEPETSPTPIRVILNERGKLRSVYKWERDESDGSK